MFGTFFSIHTPICLSKTDFIETMNLFTIQAFWVNALLTTQQWG
jgi:hypothetical protein